MTTAYQHEIVPGLGDVVAENSTLDTSPMGTYIDDYAEDHVLDPSELVHVIEPDAIIGESSKPFAGARPEPY